MHHPRLSSSIFLWAFLAPAFGRQTLYVAYSCLFLLPLWELAVHHSPFFRVLSFFVSFCFSGPPPFCCPTLRFPIPGRISSRTREQVGHLPSTSPSPLPMGCQGGWFCSKFLIVIKWSFHCFPSKPGLVFFFLMHFVLAGTFCYGSLQRTPKRSSLWTLFGVFFFPNLVV